MAAEKALFKTNKANTTDERDCELCGLQPAGSPAGAAGSGSRAKTFMLSALGPGLLVCLADTDSGCLMVAGQSGSQFGYSLLSLQVLLIPVLFLVQELTIRLGIHMKQGHTACVRTQFGSVWAWISSTLLVISCTGAIISQMGGVASVLELWGSSRGVGAIVAAVLIVIPVLSCSYRQVEAFGIFCGLFELVFVVSMFCSRPNSQQVVEGIMTVHKDAQYWLLFSSNIGAVIMPWMIFFQQSATVARRLQTDADFRHEQATTAAGSALTQIIMIGALVSLAAAPTAGKSLQSVTDIQKALEPALGHMCSMVLLSAAFIGSAMCGSVVASLTASWAVCEAGQWEDPFSLDRSILEAPRFYSIFLGVVAVGAGVHLCGLNVVRLNVWIELLNSVLMPLVLWCLFFMVTGSLLPAGVRVVGAHKATVAVIFTVISLTALATGLYGVIFA